MAVVFVGYLPKVDKDPEMTVHAELLKSLEEQFGGKFIMRDALNALPASGSLMWEYPEAFNIRVASIDPVPLVLSLIKMYVSGWMGAGKRS